MKHLKLSTRAGNPNFLFSTWPQVLWLAVPTVLIEPSGGDDSARFRAAANRLAAIGGGIIQCGVGDFYLDGDLGTIVRPENLFKDKPL